MNQLDRYCLFLCTQKLIVGFRIFNFFFLILILFGKRKAIYSVMKDQFENLIDF